MLTAEPWADPFPKNTARERHRFFFRFIMNKAIQWAQGDKAAVQERAGKGFDTFISREVAQIGVYTGGRGYRHDDTK